MTSQNKLLERNAKRYYARLMDVQIKSSKEECAEGMLGESKYAVEQDAQVKLKIEDSVGGMELSRSCAVPKDAQPQLSEEECASSMEQKGRNVATKGVQME